MPRTKPRILIVDDQLVVCDLLNDDLTDRGYLCATALDGGQALTELEKQDFDIVLLDIRLPGISGMEVLSKIRSNHPDTATIMITAVTSAGVQCMREGAYDYITKPFNLDEVVLSVDRALEKRRLKLENRDYQQHLEQKVEEQAEKTRAAFLNAITALAYALEAKDKYTSGHSQRVAEISAAIAKELGMSQDSIAKVRLAGLIHDIGKIGVREAVLNKSGKLTEEEYQHVMSHCEIGERILSPIVKDSEILKMVRHHHERYDGTGYPDGLSGKQIPRGAEILAVAEAYLDMVHDHARSETLSQDASILAVADAYDAMTSDRPYRGALPVEEALEEIRQGAGTQFDPAVADAFLRISIKEFASSGV